MTIRAGNEAAKRGLCSVCGKSCRLRKDGTVRTHAGNQSWLNCYGSGERPIPEGESRA